MSHEDKKIDLATAKTWTKAWRDSKATNDSQNLSNAFLISAQVLEGLLAELKGQSSTTAYARAYMAIDPATNTETLVMVGTLPESEGGKTVYRDMITGEDGTEFAGGGSIYDFTLPCPPRCDDNSPLN